VGFLHESEEVYRSDGQFVLHVYQSRVCSTDQICYKPEFICSKQAVLHLKTYLPMNSIVLTGTHNNSVRIIAAHSAHGHCVHIQGVQYYMNAERRMSRVRILPEAALFFSWEKISCLQASLLELLECFRHRCLNCLNASGIVACLYDWLYMYILQLCLHSKTDNIPKAYTWDSKDYSVPMQAMNKRRTYSSITSSRVVVNG